MRFADLLDYGWARAKELGDAGEFQREAQRRFPAVALEHGLKLVDLFRPVPPIMGRYVMVGVAAGYSRLDLEVLDEVGGALRWRRDEEIELLDISGPEYPPDVLSVIRLGVPQGSVVAVWDGGRLVRTEFGARARAFLRSRYQGQP